MHNRLFLRARGASHDKTERPPSGDSERPVVGEGVAGLRGAAMVVVMMTVPGRRLRQRWLAPFRRGVGAGGPLRRQSWGPGVCFPRSSRPAFWLPSVSRKRSLAPPSSGVRARGKRCVPVSWRPVFRFPRSSCSSFCLPSRSASRAPNERTARQGRRPAIRLKRRLVAVARRGRRGCGVPAVWASDRGRWRLHRRASGQGLRRVRYRGVRSVPFSILPPEL